MPHALELIQVTKTYPGGLVALRNIDLSVEEGDFYALLGRNGAGKSTLIGIIASLVRKSSGVVRLLGYDSDHQPRNVKRLLGLVPQEVNFNPFETSLNILKTYAGYFGIRSGEAYKRAKSYLTQLGLWEKRDVYGYQLSGGMKRRLMLARALMHQPRVVILDEPTAGVDLESRHSTWEFLKQLNRCGTTIILTTHYFEEAEALCRHVGVLHAGRLRVHEAMHNLANRLQGETVVLHVKAAHKVAPQLIGYEYTLCPQQTQLEVVLHPGQQINDLFQQLTQQNVQVVGLRTKQNRLEAFFSAMTADEPLFETGAKQQALEA